ncbi:MAG: glycosyltransferase [Elusimicrobia bacterium]|nr:glycosyltransferase [Elusimicrobiota bacterium]
MKEPRISVLLPVRNEAETVASVIVDLLQTLRPFEILLLDDGSTDGTVERAQKLNSSKVKIMTGPALGKSAALSRGILRARGDILVLMDGDGQFSARDAQRLVEVVRSGARLALGTVPHKWRGQSLLRFIFSRSFRFFVRWIWGMPWRDVNCGLKAVRAEVAQRRPYLKKGDDRALPYIWGLEQSQVREVEVSLRTRRGGVSRELSPLRLISTAVELLETTWRVRRHVPNSALAVLFAMAFFAARLPLIFATDRLVHLESSRHGVLASALLTGANVSLGDVWFYRYEGESLLESLIAVPLYWLFGESGEVLRFIPLAASIFTGILFCGVVARVAGRQGGMVFGILWIAAPPYLAAYGLLTTGDHLYAILGDALVLFFSTGWLQAKDCRCEWAAATGMGMVLAVFLHTGALAGVAVGMGILFLGIFWPPNGLQIGMKEWRCWAGGMSLLALPIFSLPGFMPESLGILRRIFWEHSLLPGQQDTAWAVRIWRLVGSDLPFATGYSIPFLGYFLLPFSMVAVLAVWIRAWRKRAAVFFSCAALPLYLVIYLGADLSALGPFVRHGEVSAYRYLMHIFPHILLALAYGATILLRQKSWGRRVVVGGISLLAIGGLVGQAGLLAPQAFAVERPRTLEADFTWLGKEWMDQGGEPKLVEQRCETLRIPLHRAFCLRGIGFAQDPIRKDSPCFLLETRNQPWCEEGRGLRIAGKGLTKGWDQLENVLSLCLRGPSPEACFRGMVEFVAYMEGWVDQEGQSSLNYLIHQAHGTWLGTKFSESPRFALSRCSVWSPEDVECCRRGVGRRVAQMNALRLQPLDLEKFDEQMREDLAMGSGMGWSFSLGSHAAKDLCKKMSVWEKACLRGVRAG